MTPLNPNALTALKQMRKGLMTIKQVSANKSTASIPQIIIQIDLYNKYLKYPSVNYKNI